MRKITIPVSAVLALSAIPMAQAVTKTWDFSGVSSAIAGPGTHEFNGLSVVLSGDKDNISASQGMRFNGTSTKDGRYGKFVAENDGTIKVTFKSNNATAADRIVAAGTSVVTGTNLDELKKNAAVLGAAYSNGSTNVTFTANVKAGQTIYIYNANGGCAVSRIDYEYSLSSASVSKPVDLTVMKDKTDANTDITIAAKGVYRFSAPEGVTLTVKEGDNVISDLGNVVVAKNGTKLNVAIKVAKVSKDTKYTVNYTISPTSLNEVKSVYTQKIAVMINKANVYTNDTRLQECAVQASSLMAEANEMGYHPV